MKPTLNISIEHLESAARGLPSALSGASKNPQLDEIFLALLPRHPDPSPLTRREAECLRWVAAGRSDPQIGMILGLSPNTVHAHVESAKTKLAANSRAQLVLRAVMAGILRSDVT